MQKFFLRLSPWFISAVSLLVMIGWLTGSDTLVRIAPGYTSMKFATAFLFFITGLQWYFLMPLLAGVKWPRQARVGVVLSLVIAAIVLVLTMVRIAPAFIYLVAFLPHETIYDPWTALPLVPTALTIICFGAIASVGVYAALSGKCAIRLLPWVGSGLMVVGLYGLTANLLISESISSSLALGKTGGRGQGLY